MDLQIGRYESLYISCDKKESEAVWLAVKNLKRDFRRVLDCQIEEKSDCAHLEIVVGTIGISDYIQESIFLKYFMEVDSQYRKEAFLIEEREGKLLIIGMDRRGTVYGIYDFCENWLGVSPWYFFADVPIRQKIEIRIPNRYRKFDFPSVEYRGIFINDEEELEHWVQRFMGEDTIGVKTYEKIFELLLRLKMNYIWPAMHVNSFNRRQENGALADRMGIVVGTSHCDMLMRSNNREWQPWLLEKGYSGVEYDFSISGRNREILEEYWRESIEQNKKYEVSYTLGMRGIHDSGFETKTLQGLYGEKLLEEKIRLLDSVIQTQEKLLGEILEREPFKIFVPYKEVLELYDNGLEVPEDLTLIWVNDNYGYIRRYPQEKEKNRRGGNGIYYHNSYWAPLGGSYLFLCSIPLSHTRNELKKAYAEGIRKVWVTNFGAIKPLEQQISFYARFAWEAGKEDALTENEQIFLQQWIDSMFSGGYGKELSVLLTEFDALTNSRKVEQMDADVFSQTAYGDEAVTRIHRYEEMFARGNQIWKSLPLQEQDAFFQMILMKIHAAYFTNLMYYYADRSNLCMAQGKKKAAQIYTERCKTFDHARRSMLIYYNQVQANGKWNGILTPEDFPPPRTAMHPACMPPLAEPDGEGFVVCLWNQEEEIVFTRPVVKWLELGNRGNGSVCYSLIAPEWIWFIDTKDHVINGVIEGEERILFCADWDKICRIIKEKKGRKNNKEGSGREDSVADHIQIYGEKGKLIGLVSVTAMVLPENLMNEDCVLEDDGMVSVEAEHVREVSGWLCIPNLGRDSGALMEAEEEGAVLSYAVTFFSAGKFLLELHRFPSLNSIGEILVGISLDEGEMQVLKSESEDEHCGNWKQNVQDGVDKLYHILEVPYAGRHIIRIHAISKYFAFSRFVIYTKKRKENNLGKVEGCQRLPKDLDADAFVEEFYGREAKKILPRPVLYLPKVPIGDSLAAEDISIQPKEFGKPIQGKELVERGRHLLKEENGAVLIEAVSALAQSEFAFTANGDWSYCSAPSYGETGLALYIRTPKLSWKEEEMPALHYRMRLLGGRYWIWIRAYMWGTETSHFMIGIDGTRIQEKELYGGNAIWRYSNEQVWKWIPIYKAELAEGEHLFSVYACSSGLRFERIYITCGEELPPV